ncbi:coiled-coil domain-containing protein 1-like [Phymastichus coffea]|uniref:coiled-coil domain-containing protein 1-like n=1 Tax=Phymastichus coffea TaxID=108790 RepID=UPI00273C3D36|nr:coiled-coil domain-containing protein 1-like [Phymastichus coffea]
MEWYQPDGSEDCYFCNTEVSGLNSKSKIKVNYAKVTSVKKAVEKSSTKEELYVLEKLSIESDTNDGDHNDEDCDDISDDNNGNATNDVGDDLEDESYESDIDGKTDDDDEDDDIFLPAGQKDKSVKLWSQDKLNDLVRELNLPKDGAEHLASALKGMNQLASSTRVHS